MTIADIMQRFPRTVYPDDDLIVARDMMVWSGIRHLPVLSQGKLVGVLTERDVLAYQARLGEGERGGRNHPVERAMHPSPQSCAPSDSVIEVAARLAASKIGCLPVTEFGELVGFVTTTDVLESQVRAAMTSKSDTGPTVADVMTADPHCVRASDGLLDAAARMRTHGVRHLPVVDGDRRLIGMLSDRDVRGVIGAPRTDAPAEDTDSARPQVGDAMTRPGTSVSPGDRCSDVARHFIRMTASAVAVTDEDEVVVGILSYIDLLRVLAG